MTRFAWQIAPGVRDGMHRRLVHSLTRAPRPPVNRHTAMRFAGLVKTVLPGSIRQVLSDNGSEFAGTWDEYAKQQGWHHCYTYPHCPKRNACSERFKRTVQEECVDYQEDLPSDERRGFNDCLLAYWQRYNGYRPHRGLGCLTSCQASARQIPDLSSMWWPIHKFVNGDRICYSPMRLLRVLRVLRILVG